MKILILTSKNKGQSEMDALIEMEGRLKEEGHEVVKDEDLDWNGMKKSYGGTEAAYNFVSSRYPKIIVIEGSSGHVGKGVFSIVNSALRNNRPVEVLRDGEIMKVVTARVYDANDWKFNYGELVARQG